MSPHGKLGLWPLSPDAVGRSLKVVIPPGLHKWNVESLGHGLNVIAENEKNK